MGNGAPVIGLTATPGRRLEGEARSLSSFYFNQIDCGSERTCCAAGEASSGPEPGIRIYCTTDAIPEGTRPDSYNYTTRDEVGLCDCMDVCGTQY